MMKRLLIRADDLGYSDAVNCGIAKTVNDGLIRCVGVMPNMPEAKNGLNMLMRKDVCLGQHTNICIGMPLSDPKAIPSLVRSNGEFKSSKEYNNAGTDIIVLDEVIIEIEAQYQRYLELTGEEPHYFEGHAVFSGNLLNGLEIVARQHGLKYSGFVGPGEPMRVGNTVVFMNMESMKPDYAPFEALKQVVEHAHEDACEVFICHPGYLDAYILKHSSMTMPRPLEVAMLTDPEVKHWLNAQDIQLVTYDNL
ncbi:MAG: ChbG/HpnK family deacetylase [Anaerolineaceae bacterium]|nr:ChbG/HpnK family deacetylase [Anaerolineaceae bacterium]